MSLLQGWPVGCGLPDDLPGEIAIEPGTAGDLDGLLGFHYAAGRPATLAAIRVARYQDPALGPTAAGCAVLSYPSPRCRARERALAIEGWSDRRKLEWVNANLRTISRVIVDPRFRGLGLASRLIESAMGLAGVGWVESIARMGRFHPVLRSCGFAHDGAGYFLRRVNAGQPEQRQVDDAQG